MLLVERATPNEFIEALSLMKRNEAQIAIQAYLGIKSGLGIIIRTRTIIRYSRLLIGSDSYHLRSCPTPFLYTLYN